MWLIDFSILDKFSSRLIPKAVFTWKSCAFPTKQTEPVSAFRTAARTSSFSADLPSLLVIPKATILAFVFGTELKNSLSVGFAPGQPPSI